MNPIVIPTKEQVPEGSQKYFDYFMNRLGMMPNLYAVMAYSEPGISSYLQLQKREQVLNRREHEIVNLIVSAMHRAEYCMETHAMIARLNGLDEGQISEIKEGSASFDEKLHTLARLVRSIVLNRTRVEEGVLEDFFGAGYELAHLFDVAIAIADSTIANIVANAMNVPTDRV